MESAVIASGLRPDPLEVDIYIALLRGINVSGQKPIGMADLKRSFEALGLRRATTYLQSGNVVFEAGADEERRLASALEVRISQDFGHDVKVIVLPAEELRRLAASNPLYPTLATDERLFHCTFLSEPVSSATFAAIKLPALPEEEALLAGRAVLLYCPHGYGKTKLNNGFFERVLGMPATTRNWRTVLSLTNLSSGKAAVSEDRTPVPTV